MTTVVPLSKTLNPVCSRAAVQSLTLHYDPKKLAYVNEEFSCTVQVYMHNDKLRLSILVKARWLSG